MFISVFCAIVSREIMLALSANIRWHPHSKPLILLYESYCPCYFGLSSVVLCVCDWLCVHEEKSCTLEYLAPIHPRVFLESISILSIFWHVGMRRAHSMKMIRLWEKKQTNKINRPGCVHVYDAFRCWFKAPDWIYNMLTIIPRKHCNQHCSAADILNGVLHVRSLL